MVTEDIELEQGIDLEDDTEQRLFLSAPSWIVLALIALVPVMFGTGFSSFEHVKTLTFGLGAGISLLVWGLHVLRGHQLSLVAGRVNILFFVFLTFVVLALSWSQIPMLGLIESAHWLSLATIALVIMAPVGRPVRFMEFGLAAGLGAATCSVFGLLDFAGLNLFTIVWDPPGPAATFDNIIAASTYYMLVIPVLIAAIVQASGRIRILFAVFFLLAALHFGLVVTWSFAIIFGVVCLAVIGFIVLLQKTPAILAFYPTFALLGLLLLVVVLGQVGFDSPAVVSDATNLPRIATPEGMTHEHVTRAQVRNTLFAADRQETLAIEGSYDYVFGVGLELFGEQPVIGHGPHGWSLMQTKYPRAETPVFENIFDLYPAFKSPHNGWVKIAVEYGIIGLILFGLWIIAVLWITVSALLRRDERLPWLLEHWALMSVFALGIVMMTMTRFIELNATSLLWIAAIAMLTRLSAAINGFEDWAKTWEMVPLALTSDAARPRRRKRLMAAGSLAVALSAIIIAPTLFFSISNYYRGLGDQMMLHTHYERATEAYGQSFQWFPYQGEVLYNQALALSQLGQLREAREILERAVELRPYDARILQLAASANLIHEQFGRTIELARRAVQAHPNNIEARKVLAAAFQLRLNPNEAATTLIDALRRNPPSAMRATLHQRLAEIYETTLEQPRLAIDHYGKAIELTNPGFLRSQMAEKKAELQRRLERERLEREGKPIPQHLMPREDHHHHDHDGHHH